MSDLEDAFAFQLRAVGLPDPEREYKFDTTGRKWRFDFAFVADKLACEVEGGTWVRGRHTRGSGYISDCRKYNAAICQGWRVLRFTAEMVASGEAVEVVEKALGRVPEHA